MVAELHEAVGIVLGLPTSCFYLSIGGNILQNEWTLDEAGVNVESVVRARGWVKGGMQFQEGIGGGDFGQWNCTNPQCRATKCWPTKSRCYRCGAPKGFGVTSQQLFTPNPPARPPYPPPGWQPREQSHLRRTMQMNLGSCPTSSKKAARKAAASAMRFPTPVPLSKVQALELLKGDLDGKLYLELQSRLAKPHRGEFASVEAQAEEQRQRALVLQSEWQALYDKTGEDTDIVPENESVHEEGLGKAIREK